jgi:hypothetical protein
MEDTRLKIMLDEINVQRAGLNPWASYSSIH